MCWPERCHGCGVHLRLSSAFQGWHMLDGLGFMYQNIHSTKWTLSMMQHALCCTNWCRLQVLLQSRTGLLPVQPCKAFVLPIMCPFQWLGVQVLGAARRVDHRGRECVRRDERLAAGVGAAAGHARPGQDRAGARRPAAGQGAVRAHPGQGADRARAARRALGSLGVRLAGVRGR